MHWVSRSRDTCSHRLGSKTRFKVWVNLPLWIAFKNNPPEESTLIPSPSLDNVQSAGESPKSKRLSAQRWGSWQDEQGKRLFIARKGTRKVQLSPPLVFSEGCILDSDGSPANSHGLSTQGMGDAGEFFLMTVSERSPGGFSLSSPLPSSESQGSEQRTATSCIREETISLISPSLIPRLKTKVLTSSKF